MKVYYLEHELYYNQWRKLRKSNRYCPRTRLHGRLRWPIMSGWQVDAQLVGRSWYVSKESLQSHKKTRYRSTKSANKKTIVASLETKDMDAKESFSVPVAVHEKTGGAHYAEQSFYSRTPVRKELSEYSTDDSELIPIADTKQKSGKLSVSLGDSQAVKIKSRSPEFDFNPTERPDVKFEGALSIVEVYDESELEEVDDVPVKDVVTQKKEYVSMFLEPESESKLKPNLQFDTTTKTAEIANKIKVKHLRKDKKQPNKKLPIEHNVTGVLGMRRARITDRNPAGGTLKVAVPVDNVSISRFRTYVVLTATVSSVVISTLILGLETDMYTEGELLVSSYVFEFNRLLAAVYSAW